MYSEKNDGFSLRDIFIQILFIVLFVFILVCLFPTKGSINKEFADINSKLDALTSGIFNTNLQTMKDAAVSYYTTERLPEKVKDVKSMTLKEMIDNKLLVEFKDGNGKSCDLKDSYVEVVKLENEYQMKVNLSCTDNDAYIIVHLGCYDYCKATGVCEKKETPVVTCNEPKKVVTCQYEYKKVTNGSWGDFGNWSSWSTTKATASEYRKIETKTEKVVTGTKDVISGYKTEEDAATKTVTKYCPKGYNEDKSTGKCVKPVTAYYNSKCPSGYDGPTNGVCYGTKTTITHAYYICDDADYTPSGNKCYKQSSQTDRQPLKCPQGYDEDGDRCSKKQTTGCKTTTTKGAYVGTEYDKTYKPANNSTYIYETISTRTDASCLPECKDQVLVTYNIYKAVVTTTGCQETKEYTSKQCLDSSYTQVGSECVKTVASTDIKPAHCPQGYDVATDSYCSRPIKETIKKDPSCPQGYKLNDTKDRCYGTYNKEVDKKESVSYACNKKGYTLNGEKCVKTVAIYKKENVVENVTYYRYKEKQYISGTVDIRWSSSDNDTSLLNKGYSLTGTKSCK